MRTDDGINSESAPQVPGSATGSASRQGVPADLFERVVDDMNRRHSLVLVNGELRAAWNDSMNGGMPQLSRLDALKVLHRNKLVAGKNPVDLWINSSDRIEYLRGIGFEPGGEAAPGVLNMWRGFAVKPKGRDCSRFLEHAERVICGGHAYLFYWLLDFLADIVQNPAQPKGTAIVLRGPQGAGKGQFAQYVMATLAPYTCHLISSEMLIGRFNDHFSAKLFIYADEASWPGDRRGIGKLKGLITERRFMVERKNVPAFEISNHARLVISTNEDWACPADIDDRRFVVLDIAGDRRGDRAYWDGLAAERENGGPATLMAFLLRRGIGSDLRTAPVTSALGEQKLMSLDAIGQFWRRLLLARRHTLESPNRDVIRLTFGEPVSTAALYDFYLSHTSQTRVSHPASMDAVGKRLRRLCPSLVKREARRGDGEGEGRRQVYELPPLEEAREQFAAALFQPLAFGEPDEVQQWR